MSLDMFGVRVENPDLAIEIEGRSFAELILNMYLHVENLKKVGQVLEIENGALVNMRLAAAQRSVNSMANASHGLLQEFLRLAHEQGLQFEVVSESPATH